MKPWVQEENRKVRLHNLQALGDYLASLSTHQWNRALHWLDLQMRHQCTTKSSLNNHWNNHICFCEVMEAYLTFCYVIKWGDVGLLRNAMREIAIILQAPSTKKPKYAREMLRQVHILDTSAADSTLQNAYIANALVNPRGLPFTFYEIDLLLEHQNGEFKRFRSDRGSSLQETDEMLKLHSLTVSTLIKVRQAMNRVIVGREQKGRHPTKDASFDILSLADQLHRSRSTIPEGPEAGKIYFSINPMPDLVDEGIKELPTAVAAFNESLKKKRFVLAEENDAEDQATDGSSVNQPIEFDIQVNKAIDEIFSSAHEVSSLTSSLVDTYI